MAKKKAIQDPDVGNDVLRAATPENVTPAATTTVEFTEKEKKFGHTLFIIMMICILGVIAGIAWTIVDLILPQGLYVVFFHDNIGLQIAVIGIAAFLLFFLLILFYAFGKKGTRMITRAIFTAETHLFWDQRVKARAVHDVGLDHLDRRLRSWRGVVPHRDHHERDHECSDGWCGCSGDGLLQQLVWR